jgi:hypothetical protein
VRAVSAASGEAVCASCADGLPDAQAERASQLAAWCDGIASEPGMVSRRVAREVAA